jgi:hypothetical protein
MRLVQKQSHSVNRGVSDVLKLLAAEITQDIGTPFCDLGASASGLAQMGRCERPVVFERPTACGGCPSGRPRGIAGWRPTPVSGGKGVWQ